MPFVVWGLSLGRNVTYAGNHLGMPCTVGQSRLNMYSQSAVVTMLLLVR